MSEKAAKKRVKTFRKISPPNLVLFGSKLIQKLQIKIYQIKAQESTKQPGYTVSLSKIQERERENSKEKKECMHFVLSVFALCMHTPPLSHLFLSLHTIINYIYTYNCEFIYFTYLRHVYQETTTAVTVLTATDLHFLP